jgi:hypothetical protein
VADIGFVASFSTLTIMGSSGELDGLEKFLHRRLAFKD